MCQKLLSDRSYTRVNAIYVPKTVFDRSDRTFKKILQTGPFYVKINLIYGWQRRSELATAYVDGSYDAETGQFSYGIVFFPEIEGAKEEERELHFSKAFYEPELSEMRNVAGEIMGAAQAMKLAEKAGLGNLTIHHDYEGIAKWCTGEWKARKKWTQKYKAFYDEISKNLDVKFVKVKGHSGDKYNELADKLAGKALGK